MHSQQSLKALLEKMTLIFEERDWRQFHSPKNLVMDLTSEIGELAEHFRWLKEDADYVTDEATLADIKEELGDVFRIVVYLAHQLGIDPLQAANESLDKMARKYPVEKAKGSTKKYTNYVNS